MKHADREARLQRAKAIGRIAYSRVRNTAIFGNVPINGEEKQLRKLDVVGIAIEIAAPFRVSARPEEFSRLRIRHHGAKVFEIRWDKTGFFKIIHYDPGDWERTLRAEPIAFDK